MFNCEICGVGCSDQDELDTHLRGQKHIKALLALARATTNYSEKVRRIR